MAQEKIVFVAFAIEDERQRDFLKGQTLHPRQPYKFIDMSVKQAYDAGVEGEGSHPHPSLRRRDRSGK